MGLKLQAASRKEVLRIAVGSLICAAVMVAVFVVLHLVGLCQFGYPVILGALGGTAVAVLNFALMCLMVQNVTGIEDQKKIQAKVQLSYNGRMVFQGIWCVVAFAAPCFQVVAGVLPLLFPRVVIFYLQATGQYKRPAAPAEPAKEDEIVEDDEIEEDEEEELLQLEDAQESEPTESER